MSLLDRVQQRLDAFAEEMHRDRHPYLGPEISGFSRKWVVKQGGNGYRPVRAPAEILMARNPPPLPEPDPPAVPPPAPPPAPTSSPQVATPGKGAAPKNSAVESTQLKPNEKESAPPPPPFDMLDIPEGMDAMGYTYAAYCARRWFNGRAHVIADDSKDRAPKAFLDEGKFKLDWIRKFGAVQKRFDHLIAIKMTRKRIYTTSRHERNWWRN